MYNHTSTLCLINIPYLFSPLYLCGVAIIYLVLVLTQYTFEGCRCFHNNCMELVQYMECDQYPKLRISVSCWAESGRRKGSVGVWKRVSANVMFTHFPPRSITSMAWSWVYTNGFNESNIADTLKMCMGKTSYFFIFFMSWPPISLHDFGAIKFQDLILITYWL